MLDQFIRRSLAQSGQIQQSEIVSGLCRKRGFTDRLICQTAHARDLDGPFAVPPLPLARRLRRQPQHGFKQSDLRVANCELSSVDADGHAPRARIAIIPRQRALAALVELAFGVERERVRRDHRALKQHFTDFPVDHSHQNFPSLTSNFVGRFKLLPPVSTQRATHSISSSVFTSASPSNRRHSEALLSSAAPDSAPLKTASLPNRRAEKSPASRTRTISGPVTFKTRGDDSHKSRHRSAYEVASPCQMALK